MTVPRFTEPNSRVPLSSGKVLPPSRKGKTVRIDAGRRHGPSCPVPRRPGSEGGQDSASPSQVRATLRHPAASGWRADRAARSRAGEDLTRFSRTRRSCTVEVSPTLPSSKSGASTCRRPSRRPIWSGMFRMCFVPGKPDLDFIACREHILSGRSGDREACEPFLCLSRKLAQGGGDSIIPDLPTENIIL